VRRLLLISPVLSAPWHSRYAIEAETLGIHCSGILLLLLSFRIEFLDDLRVSWLWVDTDKALVGLLSMPC
jgi:hypothetical protein